MAPTIRTICKIAENRRRLLAASSQDSSPTLFSHPHPRCRARHFPLAQILFSHCKVQTGLGGDWCHGPAREHGFQTHLGPGFPFSLSRTVDRGLPSCAPGSVAMPRTNIDTHRAPWSQEPSEQLVRATNGVGEGLTASSLIASLIVLLFESSSSEGVSFPDRGPT